MNCPAASCLVRGLIDSELVCRPIVHSAAQNSPVLSAKIQQLIALMWSL